MYKQQRIVLTIGTDGKIIAAKLQESDGFTVPSARPLWHDVKPLKVTQQPDGKVSIENPWKELTNEE